MLNEQDLIAYFENTLPPAGRQRVEAELDRDPQGRGELMRQIQLDAALRASLGEVEAVERVKRSVLAVTRGESDEAIKQHVLDDTLSTARSHANWFAWLAGMLRRPAWGVALATASLALFIGLWMVIRSGHATSDVEAPSQVVLASGSIVPKVGDTIRAASSASATIRYADGTILHLEPGTEIRLQSVGTPGRNGGKQLKLVSGSLSADVAKQPAGFPLLIQTPHALVSVVGTEFDLSVEKETTALEVSQGLVRMSGTGATQAVSVAAGEFAVVSPQGALQYGRLARNPYRWPFSTASIWNQPLGSGARYGAVPGKPFLADGPLQAAVRPRRPFIGGPGDPLRRILVNGDARADVRLADVNLPGADLGGSLVLLQHGRRYAIEVNGVKVRPDGDLEAVDAERVLLNGPGSAAGATRALPFGLSNLGGLLREGELENGIHHALSARVSRDRLAGREFPRPTTVWPAVGDAADTPDDSRLRVGTLLALPPGVDIRALVGDSGPAYELARAMQDYGVYVTGYLDAPFVLLADTRNIPGADEWLNQLVPLLQVVTNNSATAPGGGGTARREPAPELPAAIP